MQIFGTRFWGFDPATYPFAGFTHQGSRDSLIKRSQPGDLLLVLGTKGKDTAAEDRGYLLGLIEFERTAAAADDFVADGEAPAHLLDENGRFRWPYAVPALRAWEFTPTREIWDVLGRQLTMAATTSVDQLSDSEALTVLDLPKREIVLPESRARKRAERLSANRKIHLEASSSGQPGPPPSAWSALVAHEDGPTATYLVRFGRRDVWKIGISKNPKARLEALNFSVPVEALGEHWMPHLVQKWQNGRAAYAMEQQLLTELSQYHTQCERLLCRQATIESAWTMYIAAHKS